MLPPIVLIAWLIAHNYSNVKQKLCRNIKSRRKKHCNTLCDFRRFGLQTKSYLSSSASSNTTNMMMTRALWVLSLRIFKRRESVDIESFLVSTAVSSRLFFLVQAATRIVRHLMSYTRSSAAVLFGRPVTVHSFIHEFKCGLCVCVWSAVCVCDALARLVRWCVVCAHHHRIVVSWLWLYAEQRDIALRVMPQRRRRLARFKLRWNGNEDTCAYLYVSVHEYMRIAFIHVNIYVHILQCLPPHWGKRTNDNDDASVASATHTHIKTRHDNRHWLTRVRARACAYLKRCPIEQDKRWLIRFARIWVFSGVRVICVTCGFM